MIYAPFNHLKQMMLLIQAGRAVRRLPWVGRYLSTMFEYIVRIYFGSDISCAAVIPGDTMFVHGHDIVIGEAVVMGHRCKIFNGVTLGNRDTEVGNTGQPVIGDDSVISTGAKVLGAVRIGDRCVIGANAVVLCDVPSDSIAVGVPAKVMPRNKALRMSA